MESSVAPVEPSLVAVGLGASPVAVPVEVEEGAEPVAVEVAEADGDEAGGELTPVVDEPLGGVVTSLFAW